MKRCGDYIVRDADDEEPDCMKCDHVMASEDYCKDCGSWWANYQRTSTVNDEPVPYDEIRRIHEGR